VCNDIVFSPPEEEGQTKLEQISAQRQKKPSWIDLMLLPETAAPVRSRHERLSPRERERLIRDYVRARNAYFRAVAEQRRDLDELVAAGLVSVDAGSKS
jgi:hypothetical protein